ncbi:3-oxoacid CoA-transferase subunit B [Streptomyces sasae]|uniref:3-oxoacid CoA-transferase subunit B n=1 Tax=Streptomyces sasae TaxID=1266772 RepID=UPI00292E9A0E|nr:3-oxoacid CoA-transferase subunit B [Streptomyces sasae]
MTVLSSGLSRRELAARIALDIPEGSVVNLGIGAPTLVADAIPEDVEVVLHTENGMLAMGPAPVPGHIDPDLINAGKQPVTERPGASYFHHADSFAMMRGGHLDIRVLGAFQISEHGDLANWHTGAADAIPAVGGAMDLATGAKSVWVMTDLLTRDGTPKLVTQCTYPLTGVGCVTRGYTNHAVFDITPVGFAVRELFGTATIDALASATGLHLRDGRVVPLADRP